MPFSKPLRHSDRQCVYWLRYHDKVKKSHDRNR